MSDRSSGRRFRGSLIVSGLLHLALFAFIVPVAVTGEANLGQRGAALKPSETVTFATMTIERRVAAHHPQRAPAAKRAIPVLAAAPAPKPAPRVRTAPRLASQARFLKARAKLILGAAAAHLSHLRMPVAVLMSTAAPERAASQAPVTQSAPPASPVPVPSATAAPTPSASPSPDERTVAESGIEVPPGGWGQSFAKPLVASDAALSALRAKYHVSAAILVAVDQSGHATSVSLPANLSDEVRADLERSLRELRYVPAECNGLRCDGTLQITL